ncbi:MAG TPA: hypothetical protein PLY45_00750 [bacterium]|nr:hypothetical protein [bacterium]
MKRPLVRPLSRVSFETAAFALSRDPGFVATDDSKNPRRRISVVASRPSSTLSFTGAFVTLDGRTAIDSPRTALASFLSRAAAFRRDPYLPFSGGAIGYVGFEGMRALAGFAPAKGFSRFPQCRFGIYDTAAFFDHAEGTSFVVSAGEGAEEKALELSQRLEEARPWQGRKADSLRPECICAEGVRFVPDDASFGRLLSDARDWLRSEKLSRLHLTRQAFTPSSGDSLLDGFLAEGKPGLISMLVTHEGAAALASSREALAAKGKKADPVESFLSSLPFSGATGEPFEDAMAFVANHEEEHRRFHGGAFGTADASGFSFHRISLSSFDADGAVAKTAGADMTADLEPSAVKAAIDELLLS